MQKIKDCLQNRRNYESARLVGRVKHAGGLHHRICDASAPQNL